jgi:RimJ/RimL family protein N-acetyltransferase
MEIGDITLEQVTKFFLADPALCYLGLSDDDLVSLYENKCLHPINSTVVFKGFYDDGTLVSVLKYEWFTYETVNIHFYISTHLQRKGMSKVIGELICKYFKDSVGAKKIIILIPHTCVHTLGATEKFGMIEEGRLTKSLTWRKELVDIVIKSINL